MSKEIEENETKVTIKRPVWEFNLYWKFMCVETNTMIRTKQTLNY